MKKQPQQESFGLKHLKSLPQGTKLYTILRHVSRSGMLRYVDVLSTDEEGRLFRVIVPEDGYYNKDNRYSWGFKVPGCGFDAGFEVVYSLGYLAHGEGYYFKQEWV